MSQVSLTVVGTEIEAELLCGRLRADGIECGFRKTNFAAGAWEGMPGGPYEILVDEARLEAARTLLDSLDS